MKKLLLLTVSLLALVSCSAHTVVVADIDLLSLAGDSTTDLSGDVTVPGSIQLYIPDADGAPYAPDGGYLVGSIPALSSINEFEISLAVDVENTGSGPLTFTADFRLGKADDSANIYDDVDDVSLASSTVDLAPGESGTVELAASLGDDPNLDLITNDGFRVGVELAASGSTSVHYELTKFKVVAKQRPFDLIPPP